MQKKESFAKFLLVDDDHVSVLALKRALKKLNIRNEMLVASDGEQALDILETSVDTMTGDLPPFIIALDVNMPRMNGIEFINAARARDRLESLTIFMFSDSHIRLNRCGDVEADIAGRLTKDDLQNSLAFALSRTNVPQGLLQRAA
ncbi:MAG: response regulator [Roseobacter sp.]